jgi:hypothetical protein
MRSAPLALAWTVGLMASTAAVEPIPQRHALGTLHGFPSMSDLSGRVLADGELTQELVGGKLTVRARWSFADGLQAEEHDVFAVGREVVQERYSWIERRAGEEVRRFEADFLTGDAVAAVRGKDGTIRRQAARLDLPRGRSFAGFGVALVASELQLEAGAATEITIVAFTTAPRAVTLEVRRDGEERIPVAGRSIPCDRYTLHPRIPFPLSLFAGAKDAHLWLTHASPPALVRAEESLAAKDDPVVVIDATPRGPAHPPEAGLPEPAAVPPPPPRER